MRVLISGNRELVYSVLKSIKVDVVITGSCRGADTFACDWAKENDVEIEKYPAEWNIYKKGAGPIANRKMLEEGKPNIVLAFHDDIASSKGTKDMINISLRKKIPVYLISGGEISEVK